jgi:hypothetical protein
MTLTSTLAATPTKELLRAYNSEKAYLYFKISVFNVGASINIICSDQAKEISDRTWNGYDFMIENDDTTKYYILKTFEKRLIDPEDHKLTDQQTKRIQSILKANEINI